MLNPIGKKKTPSNTEATSKDQVTNPVSSSTEESVTLILMRSSTLQYMEQTCFAFTEEDFKEKITRPDDSIYFIYESPSLGKIFFEESDLLNVVPVRVFNKDIPLLNTLLA